MNTTATTKLLTQGIVAEVKRELFSFAIPVVPVLSLIFLIIVTAMSLIYVKDLNRRLFIDLEQQDIYSRQLQIDQSNLLLEQSAWSTQARVQQIAEQQLEMQIPSAAEVVMLRSEV